MQHSFFTADILACHSRKSAAETNFINDGLKAMTVRQHVQYHYPGPSSNKWIIATVNVINYTCACAIRCQNVYCENVWSNSLASLAISHNWVKYQPAAQCEGRFTVVSLNSVILIHLTFMDFSSSIKQDKWNTWTKEQLDNKMWCHCQICGAANFFFFQEEWLHSQV